MIKNSLPDLDKLRIELPLRLTQLVSPRGFENRFFYQAARLIIWVRPLYKLINFLSRRLNEIDRAGCRTELAIRQLTNPNNSVYSFGYTQDDPVQELTVFYKYKREVDRGFSGASESQDLYHVIVDEVGSVLEKSDSNEVLNFGASYAYVDSLLASKYPSSYFTALDRSPLTAFANRLYFNQPNLNFYESDVFDFLDLIRTSALPSTPLKSPPTRIFLHSRILIFFPPDFLLKLYSAVRSAGFDYVVGFEQYGISRQTMGSYSFSWNEKASVVYRENMFIHNYPSILRECGFNVQQIQSHKTSHRHPDFRILSFTARRYVE